jgi:pimeloyl-ACP methyl ester carboxylesterase
MTSFVLIHGAWHGAWCWENVMPLLERQGHTVVAPDLPGMGEDKTPLGEVTLDGWATFVAETIRAQEAQVVLVGHSRAGIVISRTAELVPERIGALVYLAAFLLPDGATLIDTMRRIPPRPESEGSLVFSPDRATSTIAPDAVARVFYNTTPAPLVARAARLAGPEPMVSFTTPLQLSAERFGRVPRAYIECSEDRAIAPPLQALMVAETPCREVIRMETDHSPFYSAPEELAGHLCGLAVRAPALA